MNHTAIATSPKPIALLLDDDEVMRLFLSNYLQDDFDCRMFADGQDALNWLRQGNGVDVMLVDLNMPNLNGFQFLTAVRQIDHAQSTPVLVLSGSEQSADRVNTLQSGAVDYISKPFNPEELKARLDLRIQDAGVPVPVPRPLIHNQGAMDSTDQMVNLLKARSFSWD